LFDTNSNAIVYLYEGTIASLAFVTTSCWQVLEPNDSLILYADGPNVHVWVSGAELPLPT